MTETIADLKFKLMKADITIESRDEEVKTLALEVTQLHEDAKLSDMAWKDNQAALKAQAETIARLTAELAQCKHAPDDEGEDVDMCRCGHHGHEHKTTQFMTMGCFHQNKSNVYCGCLEFRKAAK